MNKCYSALVALFITSTSFSGPHQSEINQWIDVHVKQLPSEQVQLLADLLISSHKLAKIDIQVRKLNHALLQQIIQVHELLRSSADSQELLKQAQEILNLLISLAVEQQKLLATWKIYTKQVDELNDEPFQEAVEVLQELIQQATLEHADEDRTQLLDLLRTAHSNLAQVTQSLHFFAQTCKAVCETMSDAESTTLADISWKVSEQAQGQIGSILAATTPLFEQAEQLQEASSLMFKECYDALSQNFKTHPTCNNK